uniref:Zinc finger, CCHC-type n=1 Tax=Tanacetum cinerariifolium TaxID=118510 RepID=A0A6L2M1X5_TANCI|nr:zinc finger, CCHC-type [Tanacetum cinerariifolium]
MKYMGEADVILGIRIKRENKGLTITQSHYIEKILKKFNCECCAPVSTPIEAGIKLMPHMGKPVNQFEYSRAIGCLMYAMTSTRPNIAYDIKKLSRFTSNPSNHNWEAIIRVFSKDHTSTTGWVFLLGGGKEAEWLRNLIYEIPLWPKPISPISMHCDSAVTLAKAYSQIYNGKSRHLDHLTKGLARDLVHKSAIGMGLKSV